MIGNFTGCHVALWSESTPGTLLVKDPNGKVIATAEVTPGHIIGNRPGWRLLMGTGWSSCPGSEWDDEHLTGDWHIPVCTGSRPAGTR